MENPKFFRYPFAASGDKSTIEDKIQENGAMSYAEGYGYDYERNPATDPQAKRIERDKMNQLHHDITSNIQQYQLYGFPWFYSSASNSTSAISYPKGAIVRFHNGISENLYCSLIDNNTATPKDSSKWTLADQNIYARQDGSRNHAAISGTNNALIATLSPAPTSLTAGMTISFIAKYANTGAVHINLNGLGEKNILYADGSTLLGNDWAANTLVSLIYDGVNTWRLNISQISVDTTVKKAMSTKQDNVQNIAQLDLAYNLPAVACAFNMYSEANKNISAKLSCNPYSNSGDLLLANYNRGNLYISQYYDEGNIQLNGGKKLLRNNLEVWYGGSQNIAQNGYQIFPTGLMLQWGKVSNVYDDSTINVSLPTSFSHQFLNITCSFESVNKGNQYLTIAGAAPNGLTGFTITAELNQGATPKNLFWQALGY